MRSRKQREQQETEAFLIEQIAAVNRAAAAQEAIAQAHSDRPPVPMHDLRIHALAYACQSFKGDATTSELALRAEAFFLFLSDGRTEA